MNLRLIVTTYLTGHPKMPGFLQTLLLFIGLFGAGLISNGQGSPNPPPVFESIEVHKDNRVTFRYYARNAKEVKINTQLAAGVQPMTKDGSGVWSVTLG